MTKFFFGFVIVLCLVSLMVVQGEAGEICTVVRGDLNCNIDECASWCSSTYNGNGTCTAINCTCMYPCPR
ncbi:hypothetical protein ACET3Z_000216 [Daucus carota]